TRSDRRTTICHGRDALLCARSLYNDSWQKSGSRDQSGTGAGVGTRGIAKGFDKQEVSSLQVVNSPSETGQQTPRHHPQRGAQARKTAWVIGAFVLILLIAGAITIAGKLGEKRALAAETERLAKPSVAVTTPKQEQAHEELVLPATIQAYKESPI